MERRTAQIGSVMTNDAIEGKIKHGVHEYGSEVHLLETQCALS